MDKDKILQSDFFDIIFDNRNKAYGDYDLRRNYRKNFFLALAGMTMVVAFFSLSVHLK